MISSLPLFFICLFLANVWCLLASLFLFTQSICLLVCSIPSCSSTFATKNSTFLFFNMFFILFIFLLYSFSFKNSKNSRQLLLCFWLFRLYAELLRWSIIIINRFIYTVILILLVILSVSAIVPFDQIFRCLSYSVTSKFWTEPFIQPTGIDNSPSTVHA